LRDLAIPTGVIQRILGHESRSKTEGYLRSIGEAEPNVMEKLDKVDITPTLVQDKVRRPTNMHRGYGLRKVKYLDYPVFC